MKVADNLEFDVAELEVEEFSFITSETTLDSLDSVHGMTEVGASYNPFGCYCCSCCVPCCCT